MESVAFPDAPSKYCKFRIISGITDLVVNATGGPEAKEYEYIYTDGLGESGCESYSATMANVFVDGMNANVLGGVNNIYYNVSWTFPALSINQIEAVKNFMNSGGNLLIAGQDIGWDFMSGHAQAHGSPEATDLYENYMFSNYIADGSSANNQLFVDEADDVYFEVPQTSVVDAHGGNMYPELIKARAGADEVFFYDAAKTKAAVVKIFTDEFQMIYFGIGLEMIGDVSVKNEILGLTREWFDITLSTEEFEEALAKLELSQNYPNPANETTTIEIQKLETNADFILRDVNGKIVKSFLVEKGEKTIQLNLSNLNPGTYFYNLVVNNHLTEAKKLIIIK